MQNHIMPENSISIRRQLDRAGIWLSSLCLLHCLATMALALIIAAVAIGWGALRHRRPAPFVTAMMGLTFMGAGLAVPHGWHEAALTIIGVTLVSIGHFLNLRSHLPASH